MTYFKSKIEERRHHSRVFPFVPIRDGDGRTLKGFVITCSQCFAEAEVKRSNMLADMLFQKMGWEVGKNSAHDLCPACVARRDHKEKTPMPANDDAAKKIAKPTDVPPMSREERRLIWRAIEERWNEKINRYNVGWSDTQMAQHLGVDLEWVVEVRSTDFGEVGDDPKVDAFLSDQETLRKEMTGLTTLLQMAQREMGEMTVLHNKTEEKMNGFVKHHGKLYERVQTLTALAEQLRSTMERK